jgi:hypothetical protein
VSQHNAQYGESDSEDEDNRYGGTEFGVTGSGTATEYEEIGGADNPWTQEPGRLSTPEFDKTISNTVCELVVLAYFLTHIYTFSKYSTFCLKG